MTEQELQIAVCKELGWTNIKPWEEYLLGTAPDGGVNTVVYPLTLDLMHELVSAMEEETFVLWCNEVVNLTGSFYNAIKATTIQRATAFIAVKNRLI